MAMSKSEKAEMERLKQELAMAKAMRLPDYARPESLPVREVLGEFSDALLIGWFEHNHSLTWRVTQGCSSTVSYNPNCMERTTTQTCGRPYAKKSDVLKAARWDISRETARVLASLDQVITETEQKEATGEIPPAYVKEGAGR